MQISLITPGVKGVATGNKRSAEDYRALLTDLGHHATIASDWEPGLNEDFLIALHAAKSHGSISRFRIAHPNKPIVLVLTGTDIYPTPSPQSLGSMEIANRIVALQHRALTQIPIAFRTKARTIIHSAAPSGQSPLAKSEDPFDVCVVGHLRDVKDPMRAAAASRLLPDTSKIRIHHAGAILDEKYRPLIETETRENKRYLYLGQISPDATRSLMARSQLTVISSLSEGGARVAGESIVDGTPVIASKIDGLLGLLGDNYPAYFPPTNTGVLADLLSQSESDPDFRSELQQMTLTLKSNFAPEKQSAAWNTLINKL